MVSNNFSYLRKWNVCTQHSFVDVCIKRRHSCMHGDEGSASSCTLRRVYTVLQISKSPGWLRSEKQAFMQCSVKIDQQSAVRLSIYCSCTNYQRNTETKKWIEKLHRLHFRLPSEETQKRTFILASALNIMIWHIWTRFPLLCCI